MPPQLAAGQRVGAWRAVLDSADVLGRGFEVDLLPAQVDDFGRPQAVPISQKHHERVAPTLAVLSGGLDQGLHFGRSEVFSCSQLGTWRTLRATVRFTFVGATNHSFAFAITRLRSIYVNSISMLAGSDRNQVAHSAIERMVATAST